MSRDTILTDSDGNTYSFDNLATQKWLEGHSSGLDQCCAWLETKAVKLFGERKHKEALAMQGLADEIRKDLRPDMIKRAKQHEEEFPFEIDRRRGTQIEVREG